MKKNIIKEPKISKKLIGYLETSKYKYETIKHRTTFTAWDTAQTEKIKPQEVAKTLVMKVDNDWVLAMLPSGRNLDKKSLLGIIKKICGREMAQKEYEKGKAGSDSSFQKFAEKRIISGQTDGQRKKGLCQFRGI
jgi:phage terminase large subunit-like protein